MKRWAITSSVSAYRACLVHILAMLFRLNVEGQILH